MKSEKVAPPGENRFRLGGVATGKLDKNIFVVSEVLAKHDETYMPREVAAAMSRGKAMKTRGCGVY